jgi:hypothetical protein
VGRNRLAVGVVVPHVPPSLMGVVGVETCSQTPLTAGRCLKVYSGFEGGATSEDIVRRSVLLEDDDDVLKGVRSLTDATDLNCGELISFL